MSGIYPAIFIIISWISFKEWIISNFWACWRRMTSIKTNRKKLGILWACSKNLPLLQSLQSRRKKLLLALLSHIWMRRPKKRRSLCLFLQKLPNSRFDISKIFKKQRNKWKQVSFKIKSNLSTDLWSLIPPGYTKKVNPIHRNKEEKTQMMTNRVKLLKLINNLETRIYLRFEKKIN